MRSPSGFFHTDPNVRTLAGWASRRRRCMSATVARIRSGSSGRSRSTASATTSPVADLGAPVAHPELVRPAAALTGRADHEGLGEHVAHLAAVGAGVHAHRAAGGAGDRAPELDPREPPPGRALDDRRERGAAAADDPIAVALDPGQLARQPDDDAVVARVGNEQVRAQADDRDLEAVAGRPRAAPRPARRRWSAGRTSAPGRRCRPSSGATSGSPPRRIAGGTAHPSSRSPTRRTSPAPTVSTMSPARTRARR